MPVPNCSVRVGNIATLFLRPSLFHPSNISLVQLARRNFYISSSIILSEQIKRKRETHRKEEGNNRFSVAKSIPEINDFRCRRKYHVLTWQSKRDSEKFSSNENVKLPALLVNSCYAGRGRRHSLGSQRCNVQLCLRARATYQSRPDYGCVGPYRISKIWNRKKNFISLKQ